MKGQTIRTPERVTEAIRLRELGWTYKQIGEHMGVRSKTAHEWVTDPDGSKRDRRHARARGTCVDCGAVTSWSWGHGRPVRRCKKCAVLERTIWTHEAIIAAIRAWANEAGGIPPAATDWNPSLAVTLGHPERAEKFYAGGTWPNASTVSLVFGTWNAAITAAGFAPRSVGRGHVVTSPLHKTAAASLATSGRLAHQEQADEQPT